MTPPDPVRWPRPSVIYDHAPQPGPMHSDFRCLRCGRYVDDHVGAFMRWRYRWGLIW